MNAALILEEQLPMGENTEAETEPAGVQAGEGKGGDAAMAGEDTLEAEKSPRGRDVNRGILKL